MDLCVRCGRCSSACHQIHGQSRLQRRGIHITRLEGPEGGAQKRALARGLPALPGPGVPDGLPDRRHRPLHLGQIDIDPQTCIGCGDCAAKCPYDAISMVPRRPAARGGWAGRLALKDLFRLAPDPLPPAVTQTDDLLAVKCNLCSDAPQPAGQQDAGLRLRRELPDRGAGPRRSALILRRDQTDRRAALLDPRHASGATITGRTRRGGCCTPGSSSCSWRPRGRWPESTDTASASAARVPQHALDHGARGARGIAAVMSYPVRRRIVKRRAGPLRYWMLAHTYLGVAAGIVFLHGGADSGGG